MPRKARVRERIVWSPVWGKEYQGYTVNFFKHNMWRCDNVHSFQDHLQDAYLIFMKCQSMYPRVIEPRHFMALYKRALANSTHDKALYKQRRGAVEVFLSSDASDFQVGRIGDLTNAGYLAALLAELPEELRLMLNKLAQGLPLEPAQPKRRGLQPRESLSMQLRRLCRLPMNSDPLGIIKRLITE